MAGKNDGWVSARRSPTQQCPVCEAMGRVGVNSYCRYNPRLDATGSEAWICMKSDGGTDPCPGWKVMQKWVKGTKPPVYEPCLTRNKAGATYIPSEAELKPLTAAEIEASVKKKQAQKAIEDAARKRAIEYARELWTAAGKEMHLGRGPACLDGKGPNHPRLAAYIEARGVPMADLPGGQLPSKVFRYLGDTYGTHTVSAKVGEKKVSKKFTFSGPAMLCACAGPDMKLQCVQRIYLDHTGKPAKASAPKGMPPEEWDAKRTQGSPSGSICWLGNPLKCATLIFDEGPETGIALHAATHATVAILLSTSGFLNLALPTDVIEAIESGLITTLIVAGDCDTLKKGGGRPGQDHATTLADQLAERFPMATVRRTWPAPKDAAGLFDEAGEPKGKGVDWEEVYVASGKERVRAAVLEESEVVHTPNAAAVVADDADDLTEEQDWMDRETLGGDGPEIPTGELPQARVLLNRHRLFSPGRAARSDAYFKLAHWRGLFYRYSCTPTRGGRWKEVSDAVVRAYVWARLQRYRILKKKHLMRMDPSRKTAENVRDAMIGEVGVDSDDGSVLLPQKFNADGRPRWADRYPEDECVDAKHLLPCINGIIDLNLLKKGIVTLRPHSSRLFALSCRPFVVDVELLKKTLAAGKQGQDEIGATHWPHWQKMLDRASKGNAGWKERMWRWFGLCLTPIIKYQKAAFFLGPPGGGKSTFLWMLRQVVGEESSAVATFALIGERFGRASLVGKTLITIGDAGTSKNGDPGATLEMVKSIIGGDPVPVERKHGDVHDMRLGGKLTVASNDLQKWPDTAGAMPRRILPFRFDTPLEEAEMDREMEEKLALELPAVFCGALAGLVRLELAGKEQGFELGEEELEVVATIRDDNEPLFGFKDQHILQGLDPQTREVRWVWADDLYQRYEAWADDEAIDSKLTRPVLIKRLRAMGLRLDRKQPGTGDRSKRRYYGIGLRPVEGVVSTINYATDARPRTAQVEPVSDASPDDQPDIPF